MTVPQNPFDCLGLDPVFELAPGQLDEAYHKVLRLTHPDRFIGCTGPEKLAASLQAATANEAYQTLQSFYHRARALLAVKGHPFDDRQMPPGSFLMKVMTYQEALEENTQDVEKGSLLKELKSLLHAGQKNLREAFQENHFEKAAIALCEYKYLERLVAQAETAYKSVQSAQDLSQSQRQGDL